MMRIRGDLEVGIHNADCIYPALHHCF